MAKSTTISDVSSPSYKAGTLVQAIKEGTIAMPDFQRDFVWKPKDVLSLLASVSNRWPIGSILISDREPDSEIASLELKGFTGAPEPDLNQVGMVVFDGQQRLTSLLHAFDQDRSNRTYYLPNFLSLLTDGLVNGWDGRTLSDEDFASMSKPEFDKKYGNLEARVAEGVATIEDISSSVPFFNWIGFVNRPSQLPHKVSNGDIEKMRKMIVGDMDQYTISAIKLESHLGIEPLATIFETVNKTGVQLGLDDLMLAKLYGGFDLKEEWDQKVYSGGALSEFADPWDVRSRRGRKPVTALHVLRLIALHLKGGIKRRDVLSLTASEVSEQWHPAVDALTLALEFLKVQCGIAHPSILPDDNLALPVAAYLLHTRGEKDNNLLNKWYWRAVVDETYMTNTSTQPVDDLAHLKRGKLPEHFSGDLHGKPEAKRTVANSMMEQRRRHDMLACGIAGLLVHSGAHDWKTGIKLSDTEDDLDLHHVFPMSYSRNVGWPGGSRENPVNIVANLTPLTSGTNKSIGSSPPGVLVKEKGNDYPRGNFARHEIPGIAFEVGDSKDAFQEFKSQRASLLADMLLELCY